MRDSARTSGNHVVQILRSWRSRIHQLAKDCAIWSRPLLQRCPLRVAMEHWPLLDNIAMGLLLPFLAIAMPSPLRARRRNRIDSASAPGSSKIPRQNQASASGSSAEYPNIGASLAIMYVIRALTEEAKRQYEQHLMECETCQELVDVVRGAVSTTRTCATLEARSK